MFAFTHYERKVIIFLSLIICLGAVLKYNKSKISCQYTTSNYSKISPVNINTATEEELENIPYIGKKLASSIIEYRFKYGKFNNLEDLLKVKGIGRKKLNLIKDYINF